MSDQATSGESNVTPATAAEAAPSAPAAAETKPFGSFGNARGSGLARGKRPTPAAAPSAAAPSASGYKPSSLAVITAKSEYVNPFTGETTVSAPVNEPAPQAAPAPAAEIPSAAPVSAEVLAKEDLPVVTTTPAPTLPASEVAPFTPPARNEPAPASPQPQPPAAVPAEKAEIKILPPADVRRPAVNWGGTTQDEDTRPQRDQRPSFQPERREPRKFEPREPREPRNFDSREPRRDPSLEQRGPLPRNDREQPRVAQPTAPAAKSGGFLGWLKGLFGGKSAAPAPAPTPSDRREGGQRDGQGQFRDGEHGGQRRHRGGRGRGGQGGNYENRGPRDSQPRDPRDQPSGGGGYQQGGDPSQGGGERRYEGGGGRRRRRGGRGRYRGDDRGGPAPEGQQGGGAI